MSMSLGVGIMNACSPKQQINTPSSTHAELIGVSDSLPKMLWCRYFMEAQGYIVQGVYVYQDTSMTTRLIATICSVLSSHRS